MDQLRKAPSTASRLQQFSLAIGATSTSFFVGGEGLFGSDCWNVTSFSIVPFFIADGGHLGGDIQIISRPMFRPPSNALRSRIRDDSPSNVGSTAFQAKRIPPAPKMHLDTRRGMGSGKEPINEAYNRCEPNGRFTGRRNKVAKRRRLWTFPGRAAHDGSSPPDSRLRRYGFIDSIRIGSPDCHRRRPPFGDDVFGSIAGIAPGAGPCG